MHSHRRLLAVVAAALVGTAANAADGIGNLSLTATSNNPRNGATITVGLHGPAGKSYTLRAGQPGSSYVPGVGPVDLVMGTSTIVATGTFGPSGTAMFSIAAPAGGLSDVVYQGFCADASSPTGTSISNAARVETSATPSLAFLSGSFVDSMPAYNANEVACGDVDGDGDIDLYVPTYLWNAYAVSWETQNLLLLNDGTGHFSYASHTHLPSVLEATNKALLVDLDGDGDLDIVTANGQKSSANPVPTASRIYKNDGTGHFTLFSELPGGPDYIRDIAAGDVDGDGDVDLVLGRDGNYTNQPANERLLLNNGTGVFVDGTAGSTSTQSSGGNGNGNGNGNGGGGGSGGGGSSSGSVSTGITPIQDRTTTIDLADFDGDGDLDLFTTNYNTTSVLYRNNGLGLFTADTRSISAADTTWATNATFGDLDGDGDIDAVLVIRKPSTPIVQEVRVFRNKNGAGLFERVSGAINGVPVNDNVYDVTLGDLDGDGDLDMIASRAPSMLDWILLNNGSGSFTPGDLGLPTPLNKRWPVLFDATGDNVLDIAYSLPVNNGTVTVLVR